MKKFLRIKLPALQKDVPPELDASILSAAAMRAKSARRKRVIFKVAFPGVAVGSAAAAAVIMAMIPSGNPAVTAPAPTIMTKTIGLVTPSSKIVPTTAPAAVIPATDMLALADTTALEQECYNLSTMPDFSLDTDSFTI